MTQMIRCLLPATVKYGVENSWAAKVEKGTVGFMACVVEDQETMIRPIFDSFE